MIIENLEMDTSEFAHDEDNNDKAIYFADNEKVMDDIELDFGLDDSDHYSENS